LWRGVKNGFREFYIRGFEEMAFEIESELDAIQKRY
jgi:hypothetical protein